MRVLYNCLFIAAVLTVVLVPPTYTYHLYRVAKYDHMKDMINYIGVINEWNITYDNLLRQCTDK